MPHPIGLTWGGLRDRRSSAKIEGGGATREKTSPGNRWDEKKGGALVVMTRAPRPSREERLSATKNRVRFRNRLLVNTWLTKPGIFGGRRGCRG
jgi:hypothetical protein